MIPLCAPTPHCRNQPRTSSGDGTQAAASCSDVDVLAREVPLFGEAYRRARSDLPATDDRQVRATALRALIDELVSDLIRTTGDRVSDAGVRDVEGVRSRREPHAGLSARATARNRELKAFLRERLYRHPRIERMKDKSRRILLALFDRYMENPRLLSDEVRRRMESDGAHRAVADFIAGMTDRYAAEEYRRLFDPTVRA